LQEEPGRPTPGLGLRTGAALLEHLYSLGAIGRRSLYDHGWLQPKRLPCPVLSIGNLVAGGTGKTPLTAFLAGCFQAGRCRVAILSRGYGGQAAGINVVSDGRRLLIDYPEAGDEACLLARKLPEIPIITGPDRFQAGMLAWERFRPELFLLDDAFQHVQLYRDLDIVLLDAKRPFGNGRMLPRGPLREPVSTLNRPLVLVLTRYEPEKHHDIFENIRSSFPGATVVRSAFRLSHAVKYPEAAVVSLSELAQMDLTAMAGLAHPEFLAASLEDEEVKIKKFFEFPDHHAFSARELAEVTAETRRMGAAGLVTTEKDWIRMARIWDFSLPLFVASLEVKLLDSWPVHLLPQQIAQKFQCYE
jgi:tetraacyldisaccharide 4'-kinase